MNRDEAQFLLRGYRAESDDANEAKFEAALAWVRKDPELARWFEEEQALDAAFCRKIRASIPVPPDLKRQLLLARSTAGQASPWNRWWSAIAAAAALVLVTVGSQWSRRFDAAHVEQFRTAMVRAAQDRMAHSDIKGIDAEALRRWLAANGGDAGFVLPPQLPDKAIAGCKLVTWQRTRVTMLCFRVDGSHADLFVLDVARLPGIAREGIQRGVTDDAKTTLWCRANKFYLLVEDKAAPALKRMI